MSDAGRSLAVVTDPAASPRDIAWYAAAIDRAAAAESVYSMALAIREEVGVPLFSMLPEDATPELKASCWVFDYVLEFDGRHARLNPRVQSDDEYDPPANQGG